MMKMMMNKKLASASIAAVMLFAAVPVTANAEEITANDITYSIDENGDAHVVEYSGSAKEVVVPDSIDGYTVRHIDKNAFRDNTSLEKVVLPEGLRTIGQSAFSKCTGLVSVNFPEGLEAIAEHAFDTNHSLKTMRLNRALSKINNCSFQLCIAAETITIPPLVETVPDHALHGMHELKTLRFCDGVKKIEEDAALNGYKVSRIIIPPSVEEIQEHALGYRFYSPDYALCSKVEIYGKSGSEAERYAKENYIPFVEFDFAYGDINKDGLVDAVDASSILSEYVRRSTKGGTKYSKADELRADINDDMSVDAVDASLALAYYSYASSGGKKTPEEYFFLA
jgi:hypothetical protein